ncbi:MAG: PolC-type DNA polymerase III, partial [Butyrivibrio sp.]|nr:PolC-type DNA polymerase III [Butyrivibrio sp.]
MSKSFFEVFPALKLDEHTREIMEQTMVEKVSTTRKQDFIRIYISSNRLIEKSEIIKTETNIKRQFFNDQDLTVKIYEKFSLSAQYTPSNLLDIYRESIEMELKDYDHMEYSLFRSAQFVYPDADNVVIKLEDTVVGKKKAPDLMRVLSKIINERCGLEVAISPEFVKVEKENSEPDYSTESAKMAQKLEAVELKSEEKKKQKEEKKAAKENQTQEKTFQAKAPQANTKESSGGFSKGNWSGKRSDFGSYKRSDNPDVLFGRDFDEETMKLVDLVGELGEVVVHGKITAFEQRDIRNEKSILIFDITDFTDSITVKMFVKTEDAPEICKDIKPGAFIKVKGIAAVDKFDHELSIQSVVGVKKIADFTTKRTDTSEVKRVELHCHTKMSDMDGVSEVRDIVKQAYKWGMPGIAITDHGVVQSLTDANHLWEDLLSAENKRRKEAGEPPVDRQNFFKLVLGVEAYLVDDLKEIVVNDKGQPLDDTTFVVFDIETTGFSPIKNKIIEIGAVKIKNGEIIDRFSEFINPEVPIPYRIEKLTSINDEMVMHAPNRDVIVPRFVEFCEGAVLVGHNVAFDISFINQNCKELGIDVDYTTVDTLWLSRYFFPLQAKHTLDAVAKTLNVVLDHHHRAVDDAECTALIFNKFVPMLKEQKAQTLTDVNILGKPTPDMIRHLRPTHCIILAKNTLGRVNLYTLVSKSHIDYFRRFPLIPKSELLKYREGLIIGSACCAGELYGAVVEGRPPAEIARLVEFYDYLEIQPVGNNHFMVDSERYEDINSDDDIREINKEIVKLGEQFNKPVVATCDAHFLNPEDEIYRTIIMAGKGMNDEEPAPLFLRTTEEMMAEFDYLGADKAQEIVVENTRKILDMCDSISPVRPDKCPPVIENSDEILTKICYDKAHEIYGDELPEIVKERLERELNSIIKNGFAVMYIIAQKLVWKSNEDGYLVGSRGSVGSSFVAFTSGITEVNSLSPHYVCPKCKYSDFDSEDVLKYGGNSGCDMPDKRCPKCGTMMYKDGFDIPFETFLGFKGDKEPDIDLNFSGEYQSKAHKYTEVIFGYGQTFRAGTIASLADKTAYGFVKKYYDGIGVSK